MRLPKKHTKVVCFFCRNVFCVVAKQFKVRESIFTLYYDFCPECEKTAMAAFETQFRKTRLRIEGQ